MSTFLTEVRELLVPGPRARLAHHRGHLFTVASSLQSVFLLAGVILAVVSATPLPDGFRYSLIFVLAVAMGIQNASARKLAVPDLTSTVLTLTITGVAADSALAGGAGSRAGRRLIAVAVMLAGAVIGAALVLHRLVPIPLVIALVLTALAAATAGYSVGAMHPGFTLIEPRRLQGFRRPRADRAATRSSERLQQVRRQSPN